MGLLFCLFKNLSKIRILLQEVQTYCVSVDYTAVPD